MGKLVMFFSSMATGTVYLMQEEQQKLLFLWKRDTR